MIEKLKSTIKKINPRSRRFKIGVSLIVFIVLVTFVLSTNSPQQETNIAKPFPTPTPGVLIPGKDYVQGEINVKFKDGLTDVVINESLSKYNASIKSTISGINVKIVEVPAGQEKNIQDQLTKEGIVKYAGFNHIIHPSFLPNDPDFTKQYGLKNTGQNIQGQVGIPNADIHAEKGWDVKRGNGVKVAILDGGIDMSHPEFTGRNIIQHLSKTSYIDDKYGHGTFMAGILAANTNNGQGIAGTCPDCQLMIGKIAGDDGATDEAAIAAGITWATDSGAKVISISFNTPIFTQVDADAVNYAWSKGVVLVGSAGNNNSNALSYPAAYPHVVSVASTDNKNQKLSMSNYGSWVQVAAPGKDIYSTLPTHQNQLGSTNYAYLSGTSASAPMVAGVAALIWSSRFGTSNQAVVDRLYSTADKIAGTGTNWQHGLVNAEAAVGGSTSQIRGIKVVGSGSLTNPLNNPPGNAGIVYTCCDSGVSPNPQTVNPYAFNNLSQGLHRIAVQNVPTGWELIGFTYCYDRIDCHNEVPSPPFANTDEGPYKGLPSVVLDTRGHSYADLYWHFKQASSAPTITPTIPPLQNPTTTIAPTNPVPTFVCGGSPISICASPTVAPTSTIIHPTQIINQQPLLTGYPTAPPQGPNNDPCLNLRDPGFGDQIHNWVQKLRENIFNFIHSIFGNPNNPNPTPPTIIPPCIKA